MAANVESMFYTRTAPWHGLGVRVEEVLGSKEALIQAGLDWKVEQTDVYAASGERIPGSSTSSSSAMPPSSASH